LITECENVEVDCPQLCSKKVARKNINDHLDNSCAHTKPCKLKEFGCKFVARGVDWEEQLKVHLSANATDHIEKLAEVVKSHSAVLNPPKSECQIKCEKKIKVTNFCNNTFRNYLTLDYVNHLNLANHERLCA
jgi:hypothetical protein